MKTTIKLLKKFIFYFDFNFEIILVLKDGLPWRFLFTSAGLTWSSRLHFVLWCWDSKINSGFSRNVCNFIWVFQLLTLKLSSSFCRIHFSLLPRFLFVNHPHKFLDFSNSCAESILFICSDFKISLANLRFFISP